jgi:anti-sigma regulatory factor (Ser/Thr protein kinase)
VLYSDGLIERHGESLQAGLDRLVDAAGDCRQLPVHGVCARLLARLISAQGYSDDVVVVALRPVGSTADCHVDCIAAGNSEIPLARRRLRAWLAGLQLAPELSWDLLLAAGEAVNNAIEHASHHDPRRFVALEGFADRERIVLSVTDSGRWSKDSAKSRHGDGRGWGLALIHELSQSVDTTRGPLGTSVTMTFRRR